MLRSSSVKRKTIQHVSYRVFQTGSCWAIIVPAQNPKALGQSIASSARGIRSVDGPLLRFYSAQMCQKRSPLAIALVLMTNAELTPARVCPKEMVSVNSGELMRQDTQAS